MTKSKPPSRGKPAGRSTPRSAAPRPKATRGNAATDDVAEADAPAAAPAGPERIAKAMARAGLCSRRDAEAWIAAGRVQLNGRVLETPAVSVGPGDEVLVDGQPMPLRERTRLWLYHKPKGLVTTNRDPEGRTTVFERLPPDLPRVMSVGRLDINTEGLLLLTNDGGLARVLELPSTGWLRRYRVRCFGTIDQARLDTLKDGVAIDGVLYGAVEAELERQQGDNVWISIGLREGKNREVKNILAHLGLAVNRLIRVSFGPFQLNDLADGAVMEVPRRTLKDQLGARLIAAAAADLDAPEAPPRPRERSGEPRATARPASRPARDPAGRSAAEAPARGEGRLARKPDARASARRHAADLDHAGRGQTARSDDRPRQRGTAERSASGRDAPGRDAAGRGAARREGAERGRGPADRAVSGRSTAPHREGPAGRPPREARGDGDRRHTAGASDRRDSPRHDSPRHDSPRRDDGRPAASGRGGERSQRRDAPPRAEREARSGAGRPAAPRAAAATPGGARAGAAKAGAAKPAGSKPAAGKAGPGRSAAAGPAAGKGTTGKPGSGKPGTGKSGTGKAGAPRKVEIVNPGAATRAGARAPKGPAIVVEPRQKPAPRGRDGGKDGNPGGKGPGGGRGRGDADRRR